MKHNLKFTPAALPQWPCNGASKIQLLDSETRIHCIPAVSSTEIFLGNTLPQCYIQLLTSKMLLPIPQFGLESAAVLLGTSLRKECGIVLCWFPIM